MSAQTYCESCQQDFGTNVAWYNHNCRPKPTPDAPKADQPPATKQESAADKSMTDSQLREQIRFLEVGRDEFVKKYQGVLTVARERAESIDSLTAKLAEAERGLEMLVFAATQQRDKLTTQLTTAREALEEYGYHDHDCQKTLSLFGNKPCDCGLSEALAQLGEAT